MTTTEAEIIKVIADQLGLSPEDVDTGALLREELNLGPIELNDLLSNLSQKFNITFDADDVEHLNRVRDLIILIEDNLLD